MEAKLIDSMGTDLTVVNAARVSFHKESELVDNLDYVFQDGEGKKVLSEKDQKLIKFLATHNHWTPFSHVQITMREKVPIFVARQRFKHMVGFTYNEVSRRYVDDPPEFYTPDVWRKAPGENKKQGSGEDLTPEINEGVMKYYRAFIDTAEKLYAAMIDEEQFAGGIAPEMARMILPQSMYTEYYVTGSLAAWARAYKLRIDPHAQKEIQDLATMWGDVIGNMDELKYSWKALTE